MLSFTDHRADPTGWARELGICSEAVEIYLASDVIDLHIDAFIWHRVFGYDLRKRHGLGLFGRRYYGHVDFPRALEAQLTGAIWVITTNPGRTARGRLATFRRNQAELQRLFASVDDQLCLVRNVAEYRTARQAGKHGAFVGIQGGNALDADLDALDAIEEDLIVRITLVHLSSSRIGTTSSPLSMGRDQGLTDFGRAYVQRLNEKKIFVDLAHINRRGFFDAVEVHDRSQPLMVTHTGISGVYEHWRNLDDEQLRAIADTGGTIGVMFHADFLGPGDRGHHGSAIVDHLEHVVKTVGDDYASLGSDWDGAITTQRDIPTCLELPRLVQLMLDRGWSPDRIRKILGGNFLRVVEQLRG
ncbi:MAG: membrane dipeptidase [Deltaproteobacteria bacterium]|jgi:membrane dipeptidase|nr:membrane dipeptidase [Deltaproteobacteria bacterium]MBW2532131.1 membrane dipeptidase [Deltaproteobacteria bacterium]